MTTALITVLGNISFIDTRQTQTGKAVTNVGIVANKRRNNDGEWVDIAATKYTVVLWEDFGLNAVDTFPLQANGKYGQRVMVCGELNAMPWTDKQGVAQVTLEIGNVEGFGPDLRWQVANVAKAPQRVAVAAAPQAVNPMAGWTPEQIAALSPEQITALMSGATPAAPPAAAPAAPAAVPAAPAAPEAPPAPAPAVAAPASPF